MKKLEKTEMENIDGGGFDIVGVVLTGIGQPPVVPPPSPMSSGDETVGTLP